MNPLPLLPSRLLSGNLSDNLHTLLQQQKTTWDLLRRNYASLSGLATRELMLGSSVVRLQHNPARLGSTAARVDEESVRQRPCFLCVHNLPVEQRGLQYGDEFLILCNPVPIFPEHVTIAHIRHVPQSIESALSTLLRLSKELEGEFIVLYNGPRCGASAPDHLHLQAGSTGFLPLEEEYERLILDAGEKLADRRGVLIFAVDTHDRRFVAIESDDQDETQKACSAVIRTLQELEERADEPMVNILSWYTEGEWRVVIFPRAKHRPSVYDEGGDKQVLVSPAAIDLAGVVITPRTSDFERMTDRDVAAMFREVLIPPDAFEHLRTLLVMRYGRMTQDDRT
jgi:ATP adenylyltransferase/5',5'''-P-1,P-4-tetraphosphate phosphorylase II